MGAPAAGKYVSGLSGMAIDDYIKCVYEAPFDNVAGYFSQLGTKEPWIEMHTTTNGGAEVVSKQPYSELPTTPASNTNSTDGKYYGYFYLIKVDYGMLIADRMVQQAISWESLNKKNYIYGGVFDTVNSRTVCYKDIQSKAYDSATDTTTTVTKYYNPDTNEEITASQAQTYFNNYDKKIIKKSVTSVDNESNPTTITTVTTTTHYAYIPDELPDRIQNAVIDTDTFKDIFDYDEEKNLYYLNIPYNSELTAISDILNTVTSVKCTVQKDDGSTYVESIGVTWDYNARDKDDKVIGPVYKKGDVSNVIVYGVLDDMDIDPETPIQNPNNIKASVVVAVQVDQVDHVSEIPSLTVASGTSKGELATALASHAPSCTVFYNKYGAAEGTEPEQLSGVAITWDTSTYEIGVLGEQWIEGEIADLSSSGIGNDADVKARVKVITEAVV